MVPTWGCKWWCKCGIDVTNGVRGCGYGADVLVVMRSRHGDVAVVVACGVVLLVEVMVMLAGWHVVGSGCVARSERGNIQNADVILQMNQMKFGGY